MENVGFAVEALLKVDRILSAAEPIRRAVEILGKAGHSLEISLLCARREIADLHVFESGSAVGVGVLLALCSSLLQKSIRAALLSLAV